MKAHESIYVFLVLFLLGGTTTAQLPGSASQTRVHNTVMYVCVPDQENVCGTARQELKKQGFDVIEFEGDDAAPARLRERLRASLSRLPTDYPIPVFIVGHGFMEKGRHVLWTPQDAYLPFEAEAAPRLFDTQALIETIRSELNSEEARKRGIQDPTIFVRSCECGSLIKSSHERLGCSVSGTQGSTNITEDELAKLFIHRESFDKSDSNGDHVLDAEELRAHFKTLFGDSIRSSQASFTLRREADRKLFQKLVEQKLHQWGKEYIKHREWNEFTLTFPNDGGKPIQEKVTFKSKTELEAWLKSSSFVVFERWVYRHKSKNIPVPLPQRDHIQIDGPEARGSISVVETRAALKANGGKHPFDELPPAVARVFKFEQNPQFGGMVLYSPFQTAEPRNPGTESNSSHHPG